MKTTITLFFALLGLSSICACKLSHHSDSQIEAMGIEDLVCITDDQSTLDVDYENADRYTMGAATFERRIWELEVNWYSDSVIIETYDGDKVIVSESSDSVLNDTTTMYHYLDADGRLIIRYCMHGVKLVRTSLPNKRLLVRVPRNIRLDKVEVNVVGTDFCMEGVACRELELNCVSGQTLLTECEIDNLETNGVGGNMVAQFEKMPDGIDFSSVGTEWLLYVPKDAGITVEMSGINSGFDCELPFVKHGTEREYVIGNGACWIEYSTVAGNLGVKVKK